MDTNKILNKTNTSKIIAYLDKLETGTLFTIKDLECVKDVSYTSIRTIVVNLSKRGIIIRIARGIYYKPEFKDGKPLFYSITSIIDKIALKNGIKYCPKGDFAEYLIGIRTEIPKKIYCYTSGKIKTINLTTGINIKFIPSKRRFAISNIPKEIMIAEEYIHDKKLYNIDLIHKHYIKKYITSCINNYNNKITLPPNIYKLYNS